MGIKQGPLGQWLNIQERRKEDAEKQVREGAEKLAAAQQQLSSLNSFRSTHSLHPGAVSNGLLLNNTQQFHEQMDKVIQLQHQQVAIQQSQQRRKDQQLKESYLEVRKTEIILERQARKEQLAQSRREQKQLDEMASIMLRRRSLDI